VWRCLCDSEFSRFDTIPACYRQTDGRTTNRHMAIAYTTLGSSTATRGKMQLQRNRHWQTPWHHSSHLVLVHMDLDPNDSRLYHTDNLPRMGHSCSLHHNNNLTQSQSFTEIQTQGPSAIRHILRGFITANDFTVYKKPSCR